MNAPRLHDVRIRPRWLLFGAGLTLAVVALSIATGPPAGAAAGSFPVRFSGTATFQSGVSTDIDLKVVAAALEMDATDLRTELAAGRSLRSVITEHGSSVDAMADALVAAAQQQLDQEVTAGRLTAGQEQQQLATLRGRYRSELGR